MKGKTSDLLLGPMDMMPTILSMMDLPVPNGLHGKDLSKPIMDGDDDAVDSLTSLLEPIIMAVLGVLIGGLVIAMYLPIFKMGQVV